MYYLSFTEMLGFADLLEWLLCPGLIFRENATVRIWRRKRKRRGEFRHDFNQYWFVSINCIVLVSLISRAFIVCRWLPSYMLYCVHFSFAGWRLMLNNHSPEKRRLYYMLPWLIIKETSRNTSLIELWKIIYRRMWV